MVEIVITALLIFVARVTDVTLGTLRMLMLVRGRRMPSAVIGFFEVLVYILALGRVVNQLDRWEYLLVYALGFACGNILGIYIEEKMALGFVGAEVVVEANSDSLISCLRDNGYGVTVTEGWGKDGPKDILTIITERRQLPKLMELIKEHDSHSFAIVMDARKTMGGYYKQRNKSK